jgi:hypothetical protein
VHYVKSNIYQHNYQQARCSPAIEAAKRAMCPPAPPAIELETLAIEFQLQTPRQVAPFGHAR